jgi:hypothetical protein
MFAQVENDLQLAAQSRDNFKKTAAYLDQKLKEMQSRLVTAEEGRKTEQ